MARKTLMQGMSATLLGDVAAVDNEFCAGHERGFVGREEQDAIGDLDRLPKPAQRRRRDLFAALVRVRGVSIGGM
jgi:hypothetical protein